MKQNVPSVQTVFGAIGLSKSGTYFLQLGFEDQKKE